MKIKKIIKQILLFLILIWWIFNIKNISYWINVPFNGDSVTLELSDWTIVAWWAVWPAYIDWQWLEIAKSPDWNKIAIIWLWNWNYNELYSFDKLNWKTIWALAAQDWCSDVNNTCFDNTSNRILLIWEKKVWTNNTYILKWAANIVLNYSLNKYSRWSLMIDNNWLVTLSWFEQNWNNNSYWNIYQYNFWDYSTAPNIIRKKYHWNNLWNKYFQIWYSWKYSTQSKYWNWKYVIFAKDNFLWYNLNWKNYDWTLYMIFNINSDWTLTINTISKYNKIMWLCLNVNNWWYSTLWIVYWNDNNTNVNLDTQNNIYVQCKLLWWNVVAFWNEINNWN